MIGKTFARLLGALVCLTVVAAGWDAEAGHRRHRHCCAPACCTPVCETVCAPSCCTPVVSCCDPVSYTVVRETLIAPAPCCAAADAPRDEAVAEAPRTVAEKLVSVKR